MSVAVLNVNKFIWIYFRIQHHNKNRNHLMIIPIQKALLAKYGAVYDTLTEISLTCGSGSSDAQSFILSMESYGWIIAAVVAQFVLGYIYPLSLSLQSEKIDLLEAYNAAQNLITVLEKERNDATFRRLFDNACKIGVATFGESF